MATQPVSRESRSKSKQAKGARKPTMAVEPPPMRKATLRDLRYNFKEIDAGLKNGSAFEITRRGTVIAELTPRKSAIEDAKKIVWPDFMARMRETFGGKVLAVSGADLIAEDRDRF